MAEQDKRSRERVLRWFWYTWRTSNLVFESRQSNLTQRTNSSANCWSSDVFQIIQIYFRAYTKHKRRCSKLCDGKKWFRMFDLLQQMREQKSAHSYSATWFQAHDHEHVALHSSLWLVTRNGETQTKKPSRHHRRTHNKSIHEPQLPRASHLSRPYSMNTQWHSVLPRHLICSFCI